MKLLNGSALEHLKKLPSESVNCVITSPPYWALRDYGVKGQLGLEPTFNEYIDKLCSIFDEVKRVLRKDGTCWVNLGDTYSGAGAGQKDTGKSVYKGSDFRKKPTKTNLKDKCLTQIPQRFSIEMTNRGWILRNVIIWHKPNCMPSSAKDRFTVDFEYLFFFSKNKQYFFEQQFEELAEVSLNDRRLDRFEYNGKLSKTNDDNVQKVMCGFSSQGRNKRTVWKINTKPFPEAHFAVYPEELCETPIKAGCPRWVCKKCGKPKEKIIKKKIIHNRKNTRSDKNVRPDNYERIPSDWKPREIKNIKYSKCSCNAGFRSGIVLDPFMGSGTTGVVAKKLGRDFIGIDLNPEYVEMARQRLRKVRFNEGMDTERTITKKMRISELKKTPSLKGYVGEKEK